MWALSQISRQSVQERVQASLFLEWQSPALSRVENKRQLDVSELELLASRFVGEAKAKVDFSLFLSANDKTQLGNVTYNQLLLQHTENTLATVMGSSSARLVLSSALNGRDLALDDLAVLVEDASSQKQQFSQNLLQSAIENASEGMSIVDENLKLVAWNKKYLDLFDYPSEIVYVGCPVESLIRHNVQRGFCGVGDIDKQVFRRLEYLRKGSPHSSERQQANGQTIRIEGNPLPHGGFVMLFSDITAYRQAEQVLKEANLDLETRVYERTLTLAKTNEALAIAHEKAEQAHLKKSQYLKACSHDLMQPLEAARLFTSALTEQQNLSFEQQRQVDNIDRSLKAVNDLLADLAEISRLESGNIKPLVEVFALNDLFENLAQEFSALAIEQGVEFRLVATHVWIKSDEHLLRRIIQNLVGNAFRYASPGKVLLGARVFKGQVFIQILDNGPGIPLEKQELVFEQFTQLDTDTSQSSRGLGLGLNITQSLVQLLGHSLSLQSRENQGCKFSISVEKATKLIIKPKTIMPTMSMGLKGITVLCIDNDPDVLSGMVELLSAWECNIFAANSRETALQEFANHQNEIDILLVDYQLGYQSGLPAGHQADGLTLISDIRRECHHYIPAILITATSEQGIEDKAQNADVGFMRKLVKPAALRAMMSAKLAQKLQDDYGC